MSAFKAGIEGAQHGGLPLAKFLSGVKSAGAAYAQLSNYQLHKPGGGNWELLPVKKLAKQVRDAGLVLGGSCHCPIYMATGGLQVYPGETAPFHHPEFKAMTDLRRIGVRKLTEDYLPRLFEWYQAAGVKVAAMFMGPLFDPDATHGGPTGNLDSRYGWPFINRDQLRRALEHYATLATPILDLAKSHGIVLAHEPHPKTSAWTPQEWGILKSSLSNHPSLKINADPSHAWNNQTFRDMFGHPAMRDDVVIAHFKDHIITPGKPVLTWIPEWVDRGMQFCPLGQGDIDLQDFARLLVEIGAVARFKQLTGHDFFPAICEAEAAVEDGWQTALAGIAWLVTNICWYDVAAGSFEDGMGDTKK